ncbi:MAG: DUF4433 domain-containing protein [Chitinophagaceae bacterium]|nr:DUF4433 domain-containing protein [Chitinophagaceae bacterium]
MVHIDNVEHILQYGLCAIGHGHADPRYINIGDSGLMAQRKEYKVPVGPGGTLGEYIPFYFGGHSPMLLNIKTGHRGITQRPQHEIVYIICEVRELVQQCAEWVYTDGHAKDKFTGFFTEIDRLPAIVDWNLVFEQYWRNTEEDIDRQRRKQAEFLVKSHVPVSCIHTIVVRTEERKRQVEEMLNRNGRKIPVVTDSTNELYYP